MLDGRHAALGDARPVSDLGLGDTEAASHLGEPEGALLHPGGNGGLVGRVGVELGEELILGLDVRPVGGGIERGPALKQVC